jgi:LysM repeat protein
MKQWKRLLFYLLLNVLVSACTVLALLYTWDRLRGPIPGGVLPLSLLRAQATKTPKPQPTSPAGIPILQPTPTPVFVAYQVKDGDTFDSIAQAFGVTAEELRAENGFAGKTLGAGEVLRVPIHPTPAPQGSIEIDAVIGAGDLATERVLLKQSGGGEVPLAGWKLEDENSNVFIFPELTLFRGGAVNILTRSGANTVVDLYWGLESPVWSSGEKLTLSDPAGNVRSTYLVP